MICISKDDGVFTDCRKRTRELPRDEVPAMISVSPQGALPVKADELPLQRLTGQRGETAGNTARKTAKELMKNGALPREAV